MHYKNLSLSFVLAGILLVSIFAVYTYQQQKINALLLTQQIIHISPTLTSHPEQSEGSITGWQTYKNDQYGFEFQYPSTLMVTSNSQGRFSLGEIGRKYDYEGSAYGYPIEISFFKNSENKNLSQWFDEYKKYPAGREESTIQKTKLDGYDAGVKTNNLEITTFVPKDKYLVEISASLFREKDFNLPLESIYSQILSTFKFTDSIPVGDSGTSLKSATGSDSYSPDLKFTLQYPSSWTYENKNGQGILYPQGNDASKPYIVLGAGGHGSDPSIKLTESLVTVDGKNFTVFWSDQGGFATADDGNGGSYIIEAVYYPLPNYSAPHFKTDFDQILSTLKFSSQ